MRAMAAGRLEVPTKVFDLRNPMSTYWIG